MPATEFTLQTLLDQRTALQLHAEIAELTAREALARKTTAEHLLAARDIEIALSRRSRSPSPPSPPADRRLSPMHRLPSGTSEQQQMLQFFEEQRREDLRMADEHEKRYQLAAEEREARRELREAHYEASMVASPCTTRHTFSMISFFKIL
jgi:hypothetical protein